MELEVFQACPKCHGTGAYETTSDAGPVIVDPCPTCLGSGRSVIGYVDFKNVKKRLDDIEDTVKEILKILDK